MFDDIPTFEILTLDTGHLPGIRQRIDQKTKPAGSLGKLERAAVRLALVQSRCQPEAVSQISIERPVVLVFAADHGVARHPVSIAPQAVTGQMVANFLAGGAAINCFCRSADLVLRVIDAGMLEAPDTNHAGFASQRVGAGTGDLSCEPAMSWEQMAAAMYFGANAVEAEVDQGSNLLAFGEMGIGNTTSAAALLVLLENMEVETAVGRGTGISDQQLQLKRALVQQAVDRVRASHQRVTPYVVLMEAGGFEIAQICGAILRAAEKGKTILVDGFIVTVAALLAVRMEPSCRDYLIFAHRSEEKAHQLVLAALGAEPLLDLGLRLGEGTGAALAVPLLRAACAFYNDMASFDSAGVTL